MRRSTYHSEYNTKTNNWRPKSTIWRVSVASAHSHRRLSVRRCPRFTIFHCNGSALHWTGTDERHYRLLGRTRHPGLGHHRWTDAGWKAFCEPQIYPSEIQISHSATRSLWFGVVTVDRSNDFHVRHFVSWTFSGCQLKILFQFAEITFCQYACQTKISISKGAMVSLLDGVKLI